MNELINDITKLTKEWYTLIGQDHHKDRDCHWYIETAWSYGYDPVYTIHHYGYILGEINEAWATYKLALQRLRDILETEIKQYKNENEDI
jgi:hypothetical protein